MQRRDFLAKSFKSAVVMATILVAATFSTLFACGIVVHGSAHAVVPAGASARGAVVAWGALGVVALFVILATAVLVYRFDAGYFGPKAILSWLVMGVLLGLLLFAISLVLPLWQPGDRAMLSAVRTVARAVMSGGAIYVAHWLAFKAPFWPNHNPGRDGSGELPVEAEMEHQE